MIWNILAGFGILIGTAILATAKEGRCSLFGYVLGLCMVGSSFLVLMGY